MKIYSLAEPYVCSIEDVDFFSTKEKAEQKLEEIKEFWIEDYEKNPRENFKDAESYAKFHTDDLLISELEVK